ncbi:hypothetical protein SEA_GOCRAZY_50 [Arthrobacter phage GoCrazy]|nr:hypothetical protein PQB83_gp50 [Arthrobacter phage KeaneyLin]AXH44188.1 hypothetical protein SEA_KEANEYLIN_50 [Arthrobacter phage KeaneyLin]QXO13549.1 hypothetical protein SEA_GOCRAZY_50 [Arthrobacter phage GoCrazy]UYL87314.1 hypothetical protein SEA_BENITOANTONIO_51 [Arthrobacter phage BenitoAntonio]
MTYQLVIERQKLREKIRLAKQLGFHDDVAHWQTQLDNLKGDEDA